VCSRSTKRRGRKTYCSSLAYLIDEKQLTKDCGGSHEVIGMRSEAAPSEGKDFHTEEVSFRREDFDTAPLTRGRENFSATRL
jgi:hypothetical protein